MVLVYVALIILFFLPSRFYLKSFNDGYLEKDSTLPIKGVFVLLVFFRHFTEHVALSDMLLDRAFLILVGCLDQLIVTMFLFYSGYGIMRSLQAKGDPYVKGFFLRRFIPVFFQYATIVLMFLIMNLCLDIQYDWKTILLAFTGWTNIGNYHWYMFVIFALYILFILVFLIPRVPLKWKTAIHTVLSIGLVLLFYFMDKPKRWYDTLLCFNLGMWYAIFKEKIDCAMKKPVTFWVAFAVDFVVFGALFLIQHENIAKNIVCIFMSLAFVVLVALFTMKVQSKNPVLSFLGKHVFSIYMLQRLVFLLLQRTTLVDMYPLFFFVALAITVTAGFAFDFCHSWLHTKYIGVLDNIQRKIENSRERDN